MEKVQCQPLVSVIMATFNEPSKMVGKAIKSILDQTYENIELLVFDDSTNQETIDAIDQLTDDSRMQVFRFEKRKGFVPSLNEGLKLAKGKYIARMDGDDYSYLDRIEKEVSYLENNPEITVIGGQMDIMNGNDEVVSHRTYPTDGLKLWFFSCFRSPVGHPTVMFRRTIVDKDYRYNEQLKMSEDIDLWLRLMNDGYKFANISDTVLKYRVQDDFNNKRLLGDQRKYTYSVRKKNFKWSNPIHGILSVIGGWLFLYLPTNALKLVYNKENNKD